MANKVSINNLSEETLLNIFSYCDEKTLGRCCQVDRFRRRVASDNSLWKDFYPDLADTSNIKESLDKKFIRLKSNDEILDKVKEFVGKVSIDSNALFTCTYSKSLTRSYSPSFRPNLFSVPLKVAPISIRILRVNLFDNANQEFFSDENYNFDITEDWHMHKSYKFNNGRLEKPDVYIRPPRGDNYAKKSLKTDEINNPEFFGKEKPKDNGYSIKSHYPKTFDGCITHVNKAIIKIPTFVAQIEFPSLKVDSEDTHLQVDLENLVLKKIHELKESYQKDLYRKIIAGTAAIIGGAFSLYAIYTSYVSKTY